MRGRGDVTRAILIKSSFVARVSLLEGNYLERKKRYTLPVRFDWISIGYCHLLALSLDHLRSSDVVGGGEVRQSYRHRKNASTSRPARTSSYTSNNITRAPTIMKNWKTIQLSGKRI
jgi:hypothetical protein